MCRKLTFKVLRLHLVSKYFCLYTAVIHENTKNTYKFFSYEVLCHFTKRIFFAEGKKLLLDIIFDIYSFRSRQVKHPF